MNSRRRWMVNSFLIIILALIAFSIRSKREFWPFCNYPMFDTIETRPERNSIEFFTQTVGQAEEWIHEDASIGQLHHEFAFKAILSKDGWPSAKADQSLRAVVEEMRTEHRAESSWAGPVVLRAYRMHYARPRAGELRREITGRDLILKIVDPKP